MPPAGTSSPKLVGVGLPLVLVAPLLLALPLSLPVVFVSPLLVGVGLLVVDALVSSGASVVFESVAVVSEVGLGSADSGSRYTVS
jgi:hypothetical protein